MPDQGDLMRVHKELCGKLQDLPPKWARFCLDTQSFIQGLVKESIKGKKFLAAYSGGADSTALIRVLDFLRSRTDIHVFAVHLNHMLRPEADAEQAFARDLCQSLGIPLKCGRSKVSSLARAGKTGIEEAARKARYSFIRAVAARQGADFILTGHHLNDLAEDVLLRMGRGAGWPGISGMPGYDPERKLVRPFLLTPKKTLIEFLNALGQDFMRDQSNRDASFSRNRVRLEVVPLMEEISPGFLNSVAGLWKLGRIDERHWEKKLAGVSRTEKDGHVFVSKESLTGQSKAARLRLYKQILDNLGPGQALSVNLFDLDRLWRQGRGNKTVQFPGNKFGKIIERGILFGTGRIDQSRIPILSGSNG